MYVWPKTITSLKKNTFFQHFDKTNTMIKLLFLCYLHSISTKSIYLFILFNKKFNVAQDANLLKSFKFALTIYYLICTAGK